MKVAVVLIVAMVMMMGQQTDAWWENITPYIPTAIDIARTFKRQVGDSEFKAKLKAAVEDGVFTDEEIKTVFGVDEKGLAEFIKTYDMNADGIVQVKEYEAVVSLAVSMKGA